MGGDSKKHSIYCRYNAMCKKPPVPDDKEVPDLDELIKRATENGTLTTARKRSTPVKANTTPVKGKGSAARNKRKAEEETPSKPSKMAKVEEEDDDIESKEELEEPSELEEDFCI